MSDKMSRKETACACNRVKYDPIIVDHTKRIFRERWSCEDCGCEFAKLPFTEKLEIAALKLEMKQRDELVEAAERLVKHVEEVVGKVEELLDFTRVGLDIICEGNCIKIMNLEIVGLEKIHTLLTEKEE